MTRVVIVLLISLIGWLIISKLIGNYPSSRRNRRVAPLKDKEYPREQLSCDLAKKGVVHLINNASGIIPHRFSKKKTGEGQFVNRR